MWGARNEHFNSPSRPERQWVGTQNCRVSILTTGRGTARAEELGTASKASSAMHRGLPTLLLSAVGKLRDRNRASKSAHVCKNGHSQHNSEEEGKPRGGKLQKWPLPAALGNC